MVKTWMGEKSMRSGERQRMVREWRSKAAHVASFSVMDLRGMVRARRLEAVSSATKRGKAVDTENDNDEFMIRQLSRRQSSEKADRLLKSPVVPSMSLKAQQSTLSAMRDHYGLFTVSSFAYDYSNRDFPSGVRYCKWTRPSRV